MIVDPKNPGLEDVTEGFSQPAGCSKRQFSKAAASEEARAYLLGYVEGLNDARTPLADFFNRLLERHGRPCTKVGGRPCVALRTPDRLYHRLGPVKTETRAKARYRTIDRGITKSSQALVFLAPASSSPSCDQARILLVYGAVTALPLENRLARPIRSPPRVGGPAWPGGGRSSIATLLSWKVGGGTCGRPSTLSSPP